MGARQTGGEPAASQSPAAASANAILALCCVAAFVFVFNNLVMSPLLPLISEDMQVSVGVGGLIVTLYALTSGVGALVAGPILDRLGRRPILVGGMLILAVSTTVSGFAPTFPLLVFTRALAGLGAAGIMPAAFAAVGDLFPYEKRGAAMAWVLTATSSAPIFALPVGSFIAGQFSWRLTFILLGVLTFLTALLLAVLLPTRTAAEQKSASSASIVESFRVVMRDGPTAAAISVNTINRVFWIIIQVYMGAYFRYTYDMAAVLLGFLNTIVGSGMFVGSNIGGRLADKVGKRPIVLWGSAISTVFVVLMTTVASPWVWAALACLFIFAVPNGARTASAQAMLTEFSPANRGMVMALSSAGSNLAQFGGALMGGLVVDHLGYPWLGPVSGAVSLVSLILFWRYIPEASKQVAKTESQPVVAARA